MTHITIDKKEKLYRVLDVRRLTAASSIIRFERKNMPFEPGQYVRIGMPDSLEIRAYSIYSSQQDDALEILVRHIEDGLVSEQLINIKAGDSIQVQGPYGDFKLLPEQQDNPLLFIATGTGISPYHSFVASYPDLQYRLIHGTTLLEEDYESVFYGSNYFHCVSRASGADYQGRVTDYLNSLVLDPKTNVFLCGNCNMIYDSFDLLQEKGIPIAHVHTEVYF